MAAEVTGTVEALNVSRLTPRWFAAGVIAVLVAAALGLTIGPANISTIDVVQEHGGVPVQCKSGQAFMKDRFLVGDIAFVRDEMQRYRETLGVDLFRLRMDWDGLGQDKVLKSIERAGRAAADVT